jgi:hypothetical protein
MTASRSLRAAALGALLLVLPATAVGGTQLGAGKPPARIVFPIVGAASFEDDFGDPRGQGSHEANDILAERRAPVVAVEDGKVRFWTTSARAGCMLYLYGASGTTYYYIHLNNDVGRRNDNRGKCVPGTAYAPGLKDGQAVAAGQLIAYVGDSGDADGLHPHLHFELRPNDGGAVSPYRWLKRAHRLVFAAEPSPPAGLSVAISGRVTEVLSEGPEPRIRIRATRSALSTGSTFALSRDVVFALPARPAVDRLDGARSALSVIGGVRAGDLVTITAFVAQRPLRAQIAAPGRLAADAIAVEPAR